MTYFVEPGDGTGFVADRLADWYREHASSLGFGPDSLPERLARLLAAIQDPDAPELRVRPERAEGYWPCFASLVALGWTDAATDLLGMHGCWAEWRVGKPDAKPLAELLEAVVALLRTQPGMTGEKAFESGSSRDARKEATSAPQLAAFREAWLRQVRAVLDDAALFDGLGRVSAEGARRAAAMAETERGAPAGEIRRVAGARRRRRAVPLPRRAPGAGAWCGRSRRRGRGRRRRWTRSSRR